MDLAPERRLAFDGAVNFRDIGGYAVGNDRRLRWRKLFRSDNLGGLSLADHDRLSDLRLRTVVDFRTPGERSRMPSRTPQNATFRTVEIGFIPDGTFEMFRAIAKGSLVETQAIESRVIDQYRRFVSDHVAEYDRVISLLLEPENQPILMHCTSGKDRTGFGVAVVLLALGVSRELILEDYLLTNRFQRDVSNLFSPSITPMAMAQLQSARAVYLEAAFDEMARSYGSIDAYLERALGLTESRRARLSEMLTERIDA